MIDQFVEVVIWVAITSPIWFALLVFTLLTIGPKK